MDVQPADHVLEIGCGPGAGAELICSRLETGKLFAIDRSESGVDRTKRRNAKYVEAGRLTVRQIDLATLRVPVKRLNKVFAFNVNLFWVRDCADEIALLHERVLPGGAVFLFYEANRAELVPDHRAEGLGRAGRRRLPGLGRGAEGARRRRHHRPALRLFPYAWFALGNFLMYGRHQDRDRGGRRDRRRPDRGPARQPHQRRPRARARSRRWPASPVLRALRAHRRRRVPGRPRRPRGAAPRRRALLREDAWNIGIGIGDVERAAARRAPAPAAARRTSTPASAVTAAKNSPWHLRVAGDDPDVRGARDHAVAVGGGAGPAHRRGAGRSPTSSTRASPTRRPASGSASASPRSASAPRPPASSRAAGPASWRPSCAAALLGRRDGRHA